MSSEVTASIGKMKIDDKIKSRAEPAESWEDAAKENEDDNEDNDQGTATPAPTNLPPPPPPPPSSPTRARENNVQYQNFGPLSYDNSSSESSSRSGDAPERRPEKTTAVASRLIAAGLGQRAPRRTPEQREYDQAMKVQEKKKRDQAKAEEERKVQEREAAKKAIWDD